MADKRKNPLGPTPPRQPGVRRIRSEGQSEELPAASSEASGEQPPRTSTPFDSSYTDYRAPREPLSPCQEDESSESEEDPFYVPEDEEVLSDRSVSIPLPPHNSLENEPAPGLLLPLLQPLLDCCTVSITFIHSTHSRRIVRQYREAQAMARCRWVFTL